MPTCALDATETNFVIAREKQIVNVVNTDTLGVGVRVLLNGTWGFDTSRDLTKTGVVAATKEALAIAKGRSALSKTGGGTKIGEKIVDSRVDLFSDPADPSLLGHGMAKACRSTAKCGSKTACCSNSPTRDSGRKRRTLVRTMAASAR